jgi:DNA-binding transcriptional LysR family regulator
MNRAPFFHGDMKAGHAGSTPPQGVLSEAALPERLARIDLNLLVAFDALAREQNVTRAAERVGVTQSAMSHALRRLRELLDDPLLVRGKSGMVLTARAEALVLPLRSGLVSVDRALVRAERFDPRTARRKFRLATPDLFDLLAIPLLLEALRERAPGVDLVVAPLDARLSDALETGEIDLCVAPRVDDFPGGAPELDGSGLVRRVLFRDDFSCFCRADHPAASEKRPRRGKPAAIEPLSVDAYAALSHVLVSPRAEGPGLVDELLAKQGLSRRVALRRCAFLTFFRRFRSSRRADPHGADGAPSAVAFTLEGRRAAGAAALARARDRAALARALLERARPRLAARVDRRGHPPLRALSVC